VCHTKQAPPEDRLEEKLLILRSDYGALWREANEAPAIGNNNRAKQAWKDGSTGLGAGGTLAI